ncbi:type II secretion system protein N [Vibrio sp. S11_S32]|uniref:type II secretion system protein N n=1 Tax=Vibrio sp. S11_S32 TaxID=2720225 RepID=UPI0016817B8E|nr:type II secretion system protein N [Vibrio sp. S11_S32]MBD1576005.1 type II secretion system protein N [Vibrio sp. S11_S32]
MKHKKWYFIVFLVVFIWSVIAHIPASWVYNQLAIPANVIPRNVKLQGVSGTIWEGSVQQLEVERQQFGSLYWDFEPSHLLMAKVQFKVRFGQNSELKLAGKGDVGVGFSGAYANNFVASVPIDKLVQQLKLQVPVDLSGRLELSLRHFNYAQPWCESGDGNLVWTQGQIDSPIGSITPGPVIANLSCKQQVVDAKGKQNSEQVSSQFSINLNKKSQYKLTAWFKPGAKFPESMGKQLRWLGKPNGEGQYPFTFSGKL